MWENLNTKWVKERHYSQQTLKHVQQVHQVSVLVINNVTTFPSRSLYITQNIAKTIPT